MELDTDVAFQLAVAGTLAVVTDPLEGLIFNNTALERGTAEGDTVWYAAMLKSTTVAARIYLILVLVDLGADWLHITLPIQADLSDVAPEIAITIWAALTLSTIKRTFFSRSIQGRNLGRIALYDRLLDFLIGIVVVAFLLDELNVDVGMGLKSLLAGGGVGALAFSFASKDLAENIVGGLVIQAWDGFNKNDYILLGDGTSGTVSQIGLVETVLIGDDNVAKKIPNKELTSQRVSNLSRTRQSRVYQTLRFQYSDLDKLPVLMDDIKLEIQESCPKLIVDGSKPFQSALSAYKEDHIEAFVNVHFDIPPGTNDFVNNRQQVLLAIAKALKRHDVHIALPAIVYQNETARGVQ